MIKTTRLVRILKKVYSSFSRDSNPFRVLISTVLSQRTRDEVTYPTADTLFLKYGSAEKLAAADVKDVRRIIKGVGFYKTKAARIKEISRILVEEYNGKVPKDISKLLNLPGVGRKTANCVLVYAFRIPALPVDTHVHRISNRLGLVKTRAPEETEIALMKVIPEKYWIGINELLVQHGQKICRPITPRCNECQITKYCKYYSKVFRKK